MNDYLVHYEKTFSKIK